MIESTIILISGVSMWLFSLTWIQVPCFAVGVWYMSLQRRLQEVVERQDLEKIGEKVRIVFIMNNLYCILSMSFLMCFVMLLSWEVSHEITINFKYISIAVCLCLIGHLYGGMNSILTSCFRCFNHTPNDMWHYMAKKLKFKFDPICP